MRYVEVNGVRLSAIGLGTWQFGSREWGYGSDYATEEAGRIVDRALELGITLIDTAEIYGFGESERIIARALGDRRKDAFLATKVFPVMPLASIVEQRGRASARRLQTDTIDLYQIHWPNPVVPIGPQMDGMRRLQKAGVVDHVGVSNFSLPQWRSAEQSLGGPVLSNQVQYSLVARKPDQNLVPYAQANDRLVIAYSPLGMGLLSAKYDGTNLPTGAARTTKALFLPENLERARRAHQRAPRGGEGARRHSRASGVGVGHQPRQRRGHPRREQGVPARIERGRRRSRARGRRAGAAHSGVRRLPSHRRPRGAAEAAAPPAALLVEAGCALQRPAQGRRGPIVSIHTGS